MTDIRIKNRHRLQNKAVKALANRLLTVFKQDFNLGKSTVDSGFVENLEVLIIDNELLGLVIDGEPFFTVKGILRFRPNNRFVTVDMGAVKFVSNGADIMAPGVVDADKTIMVDDLVWIRDERNLQPLAIGRALMTGVEMAQNKKDKAVKSLHFVNDKLWNTMI